MDVVHGGSHRQLAVGHVQEVVPPQQLTESFPGGDVSGGVLGVAVSHPMGEGHRPIGGHGEDPDQLLEVGPVVLGKAVRSHDGRLATPRLPGGLSEGAVQAHAGGVVVELGTVHLELPDRSQHQFVEQGGPVRVEEAGQGSPDPVVIEQLDITWPQSEGGGVVAGGPLSQCVHRLVVEADVANDHPQSPCWGEPGTGVTTSDRGVQPLIEGKAVAEVVDQRQGIEHLGVKVEASTLGDAVPSGHAYMV